MATTPDARRFQRLLDEDEEAGVGAVETAEKLFAELSERLSQRKRPAGALPTKASLKLEAAAAAEGGSCSSGMNGLGGEAHGEADDESTTPRGTALSPSGSTSL